MGRVSKQVGFRPSEAGPQISWSSQVLCVALRAPFIFSLLRSRKRGNQQSIRVWVARLPCKSWASKSQCGIQRKMKILTNATHKFVSWYICSFSLLVPADVMLMLFLLCIKSHRRVSVAAGNGTPGHKNVSVQTFTTICNEIVIVLQ